MEEKKLSFEQSMKRLEQIVQLLEKGDAPLEDAMKLFSEGTALAASCQTMLEQAELQVVRLTKGEDGSPEESKF